MEGAMGTTIEFGALPTPAVALKSEVTRSVVGESTVSKKEENQTRETKENHDESKDVKHDGKPSTRESKQEGKTDQPTEQEKEPDIYQELTDKIKKHVDMLGEHLDQETKQELIDSYLSELLGTDKKKDKEDKLVDNLADMIRLFILLMKLLWLASKPNPTGMYSGTELGLSIAPPEGNEPNSITKLLNGEDPCESWTKFKDEVEKIENVSFSELSKYVLEANNRFSTKQFKLKKSKDNLKGILGRKNLETMKQRFRVAKTQVNGRRR